MKTFLKFCSVCGVFDFVLMLFIIPSWLHEDASDKSQPRTGQRICAIL